MANNIDILGEDAALVQHLLDDYSATQGHFEDDKITRVRSYTFLGRRTLKSIRLQNVTSLGVQALTNCPNLETIDLPALEYIQSVVFSGNTALKNVNMPNVKGTINNPTSIFTNDTSLPSIAFPSYNSLFTGKFMQNCTALQTFDGGMCTGIANDVFNGCTSLTSVILRKSNAAVTLSNLNAFSGTKYATSGAGGAYVYVPRDLISTYQAATNWTTLYAAHSDMFRKLEDYTLDGTTTGEFDEAMITVPSNPIYVATNYEYTTGKQITTTADGHATLTGGNGSFTQFMISDTGITNHRTWFSIPNGSTIRVTIRGLTSDVWDTTPRFSLISLNNPVVDFSVDDLRAVFNSESSTVDALSVEYTNSSGSAVPIEGFRIAHHLTSGKVLDFKVSAVMDGQRVF